MRQGAPRPLPHMKEPDMGISIDTTTLPAAWASYLVNGDDSGLEDGERDRADAWLKQVLPEGAGVVDVARDVDGEGLGPRFTWSFRMYGGNAEGGEVLDYVTHGTAA